MIKNRIVVREKSTNENRTFVLFSCLHLYTFKKMSDIIGTVTRTNSKNMTEPEPDFTRGYGYWKDFYDGKRDSAITKANADYCA